MQRVSTLIGRLLMAGVALAAVVGNPVIARQSRASAAAQAEDVPLEVVPVRENTYMLVADGSNVLVQIGADGVLIVDAGPAATADDVLATIRAYTDKPIRWIINTHAHADHTGGNQSLARAGRSIGQNLFGTGPMFPGQADTATIAAHEKTLLRMSGSTPAPPAEALPGSTFFGDEEELAFNGEPVQLLWQPAAHTDGDILVFFRRSDVLSSGDVFMTTTYPMIDAPAGGTIDGVVAALNRIIDLTIPGEKQEGGTLVIPGHGRLSDESEVVDYRDMVTIVRDRIQDSIKKGMTLEQVKAARLTLDYDGRYGATTGAWTTDMFIEAAYKTLAPAAPVRTAPQQRPRR